MVMRIKLDENLPTELAEDLKNLGHDADTVLEEGLRGAIDPDVVQAAFEAGRILFTLDKGIANLKQYPMEAHAGVVLFRCNSSGRGAVLAFVRSRLGSLLELDLRNRLIVVSADRIRYQ